MAHDEALAARVRHVLAETRGLEERRMFGGLAFLVGGHMAAGVLASDLMVRVGPEAHEDALLRPHTRPMDFTGKPLRGMVFVGPEGTRSAPALRAWVQRGLAFTGALPPKPAVRAGQPTPRKRTPRRP